ncbi:MAG: hypothetical protein INQ03_21185 [Candidatus Heimdallarchaeota archaeon]|nr:hypothetical protein [Candidatus Heimdallarchaeota archaeon]
MSIISTILEKLGLKDKPNEFGPYGKCDGDDCNNPGYIRKWINEDISMVFCVECYKLIVPLSLSS